MNRNRELLVTLPPKTTKDSPIKAVVVVLGWFGSKLRHVEKYSALYQARHCATITGHLDETTVMLLDTAKINEFAKQVVHQAAKLLRTSNEIPLVLHAFSNGGGLVIKAIENHLDRMDDKADVEPDWLIVKERLAKGAEFFDSAPVYIHPYAIQNAVRAGLPNPIVRFLSSLVMWFLIHLGNLMAFLHGRHNFRDRYWHHWTTSAKHSPVQAYVYSTADDITDPAKVEELTTIRAKKGVRVLTKRFDDSGHVQHLLKHRSEYCALLDEVLKLSG